MVLGKHLANRFPWLRGAPSALHAPMCMGQKDKKREIKNWGSNGDAKLLKGSFFKPKRDRYS